MKNIELFGQQLAVKDYICSSDKNVNIEAQPSLRLYVKVTDSCNANCLFCANGNAKDFGNLDFKKLEFVIRYLLEKHILHGISITGGEPMINPSKLNDLINMIWNIDPSIEVAISTNGLNIREFASFDQVNKLESIHVSRHHYSDEKNNEIFKAKMATAEDIMYLQSRLIDKKIININTMIMKSGINNLEEIKKNLNFVGDLDVYKNGFVSLMKNNAYSSENYINYNEIFNNLDNNFIIAHRFYNKEYCECVDGMYLSPSYKLVEFYARMVSNCECPYTVQLVYTTDNRLAAGFGKKLLLKL